MHQVGKQEPQGRLSNWCPEPIGMGHYKVVDGPIEQGTSKQSLMLSSVSRNLQALKVSARDNELMVYVKLEEKSPYLPDVGQSSCELEN